MKAGKEYEELVADIYRQVSPDAEVTHDDHLTAYNSGGTRQIDVSIKFTYAGIKHLIIIQVKDYKRKADKKVVDEFISVLKDVRANSGIIICSAGFTGKAFEYAAKFNIELLTVHSARKKSWETILNVPLYRIYYKFNVDHVYWLPVIGGEQYMFAERDLFSNDEGITTVSLLDLPRLMVGEIRKDNTELLSGRTFKFDFNKAGYKYFFNNTWTELQPESYFKFELSMIKQEFTYISPNDYTAIKNDTTGKTDVRFMMFELPIGDAAHLNWKRIKSRAELPDNGYSVMTLHYFDFTNFYAAEFMLDEPK